MQIKLLLLGVILKYLLLKAQLTSYQERPANLTCFFLSLAFIKIRQLAMELVS